MTTLPSSSLVADGSPTDKDVLRDLLDWADETGGTLPTSYTGFENSLVQVKADGSGLYPVQGTSALNLFGATLANFSVLYNTMEIAEPEIASGAAEMDFESGLIQVITLTEDITANGFTFVNLPADVFSGGLIILVQDGTGGRTIDSGSVVNAGFSSSDFDFGGINIALPSGASDEVWCSWVYRGTGKVKIREYLTET